MTLTPNNQTRLYGLNENLHNLLDLYKKKILPNKILFSGQKGIGKSTMAYHLINYILSEDEELPYDIENCTINENNRSFKLIQNKTSPNFILIDVLEEKKKIDINQIRNLIIDLNKSSFNTKPRFVLIDNLELLNINSINALLKTLEEPGENIFFILINSNKKILKTLKSRCLNFNIFLSNDQSIQVSENLIGKNKYNSINKDLLNYYISPGKVYDIVNFIDENNIDLKNITLSKFLNYIIDKSLYKKNSHIKSYSYEFIEILISDKILTNSYELFNYFVKKIDNIKRFNLNDESLFLEFKEKILNG